MSTYHIIKNGQPMEVSDKELSLMNESNNNILLDVQWYLNHGCMTIEDFEKTHPLIDEDNM